MHLVFILKESLLRDVVREGRSQYSCSCKPRRLFTLWLNSLLSCSLEWTAVSLRSLRNCSAVPSGSIRAAKSIRPRTLSTFKIKCTLRQTTCIMHHLNHTRTYKVDQWFLITTNDISPNLSTTRHTTYRTIQWQHALTHTTCPIYRTTHFSPLQLSMAHSK